MSTLIKRNAFVACLAGAALLVAACEEDPTPPPPPIDEKEAATLTVTRNGKPVVGVQVIVQSQETDAELGSATTDANGQLVTEEFEGTAVATVIDPLNANNSFLYSLRDIQPGAELDVELPLLSPAKVGSIKYVVSGNVAGAQTYEFSVLGSPEETTVVKPYPLLPTVIELDVSEAAVNANGKVTVVALAKKFVPGVGEEILAYIYFKDTTFTPNGGAVEPVVLPPWNLGPFTDVGFRITPDAADGVVTGGQVTLGQITLDKLIKNNPYSAPATFGSPTLDFDFHLIPGLSDEYRYAASLSYGKSARGIFRKVSVLPPLSTWNPATSALGMLSNLDLDPQAEAAAPRLTWTQSKSPVGSADLSISSVAWSNAGKNFNWYMLAAPKSTEQAKAQFPKLPAEYAAFVPTPGAVFSQFLEYNVDYSNLSSYDEFLENENLRVLLFKSSAGEYHEIDVSGVTN